MTSVITHLEVFPRKLKDKGVDDEKQYLALFEGTRFIDVEVSRNILMCAREIRDFYYRPSIAATKSKTTEMVSRNRIRVRRGRPEASC
jgi:hypothetical protein